MSCVRAVLWYFNGDPKCSVLPGLKHGPSCMRQWLCVQAGAKDTAGLPAWQDIIGASASGLSFGFSVSCVFCLQTPDQTPPLSLPPALAFHAHVFGCIWSLLPKGNLLCCNELDSGQGGDGWMLRHGVDRDHRHALGACEESRCSPRPTES